MNIKVNRRILTPIQSVDKLGALLVRADLGDTDMMDAVFYVEALKKVLTARAWIPVGEGLPEDESEYVQVIIDGVVQKMPAQYEDGYWYWADKEADPAPADIVTHWRGLLTDLP